MRLTPGTIVLAHGQRWEVISTTVRPGPGAGVVAKVEHLASGFVTYRHESELVVAR